ncbi:hypothetical protein SCUCBS95973_006509 [Sporothrix curviconia]|uniref:Fun14 family protein n=1 Tax=Sporothrix curviconia TaxID=1260050 RepID=A0ABP0C5Q7_9PEZI
MSALRRPAVLAGAAFHRQMASPLRLGAGLQAAAVFQSQQPPLLKQFALRSYASSPSPSSSSSSSHNNRDRSHNGSSSSSSSSSTSSSTSSSSRLRYLAASVPLVMVANEAPATSAQAPASGGNGNNYGLPLNVEAVTELSKGSVLGFLIGLLVSTFSKTLVMLVGVAIAGQSLAARAGIDLVKYLHLKERFEKSRVLSFLASNTIFKLAFGITFALSAFMSF